MDVAIREVLLYLAAMIVVVPIFKWAGLGAVLGYLIAGALLGPSVSGLIGHSQAEAAHLAEFGVIMMLLLIGLELNPRKLWQMRGPIFGFGGLQVALTTAAFAAVVLVTGANWQMALAIGMVLSLSSTAIVLQSLAEKGHGTSLTGQSAFAVLLFQDIAVIPMLAVLPLLAQTSETGSGPDVMTAVKVVGAIGGLIVASRIVVRPIFRLIARLDIREILTAAALAIVFGATAIMQSAGLSPALGAFLAGVMLADTEFRHQIEADIEPFKGLLLGLFFISIGAGIDLSVPLQAPLTVAGSVLGLIAIKLLVVFFLARRSKMPPAHAWLLGVSLAQGGEFAFVLMQILTKHRLVNETQSQLLISTVAISMACAPLIISAAVRWPLFNRKDDSSEREPDVIPHHESDVLVLGIGRFGQVIVRILRSCGFSATVLDFDADQIKVMERFGIKTYFGDARRMDLLIAAGVERVKLVVIAVDDRDSALQILEQIRSLRATVPIYVRAFDRVHAYKLLNAGATDVVIETGASAAMLGADVLRSLGFPAWRAHRTATRFWGATRGSVRDLAAIYSKSDSSAFLREAQQRVVMLERLMEQDAQRGVGADREWESAPRSS
jgi:glutathione-regulated potassium-efflux system ancillary protein KefC/glutathione-regulated potassium-efflux system protein KefB